jgi:hypothetical protein
MTAIIDATERTYDLKTASTLHGYDDIAAAIDLRRILVAVEELPANANSAVPLHRASATAVIRNPWLGTGTDEDLLPRAERIAPVLAKLLTDRLIDALGGVENIEAFGKAALVGFHGEIEHASALIHTPYFGNIVRDALNGTSILCFVDGRSEPGSVLRVPLWHKTEASTRDYYQSLDVFLPDAPQEGEIAVIAVASTGPRRNARLGDRATDLPVTSEILKGITL